LVAPCTGAAAAAAAAAAAGLINKHHISSLVCCPHTTHLSMLDEIISVTTPMTKCVMAMKKSTPLSHSPPCPPPLPHTSHSLPHITHLSILDEIISVTTPVTICVMARKNSR
jgi:hypothetical protein